MNKYISKTKIVLGIKSNIYLVKDDNKTYILKEILDKYNNEFTICSIINSLNNKYMTKFIEKINNNIIYEYFNGKTLEELRYNLNENDLLIIIRQIIDFLILLKNKGYCYYDLSLNNIMVDDKLNIKIIDYGSLYKISSKVNNIVGSYGFVPPEYIKENILNYESFNVFSLGLIIFTLLFKYELFNKTEYYLLKCLRFCKDENCNSDCLINYLNKKTCNNKLKKILLGSLKIKYNDRIDFNLIKLFCKE